MITALCVSAYTVADLVLVGSVVKDYIPFLKTPTRVSCLQTAAELQQLLPGYGGKKTMRVRQ